MTNKQDEINKAIRKLEIIMDDDFHGFRSEVWIVLSHLIERVSVDFYCQLEIEGDIICENQCKHCEEYYRPVEKS